MTTNESTSTGATVPSFAERAAAFARAQGRPPFVSADLAGTPMRVREELVRWHGPVDEVGGGEWVDPGRTVIEVPGRTWPAARPEDCADESHRGIWFDADGREVPDVWAPGAPAPIVLLCPRCGLDCT